mgnify:CR=1 FL=1|jgi:thioredoxin 1
MIEGNVKNFDELIKEGTVLVDFNANWCGPCKMLKPVLESVASEGKKIVSINVDDARDLAIKYGVMSIPCLVVFKDGKEVKRSVGLIGKSEIIDLMED